MSDIGELVVRIKADASQLQQELASATSSVKQSSSQMSDALNMVKSSLGALGAAFSVGALVEFTRSALDAANNLYILGQRTGIAASTLSSLNIPLKQNGSSVDEFASSIKFLQRNIQDANPAAVKAFDDIGLSITKLRQLTPEEQFIAVANALGQVDDQGRLVADVLALMGRGAQGLIPIIKNANGAMSDFIETQDHLTNEDIKRVHDADDAWTDFWEHMKMHAVETTLAFKDFIAAATSLPNLGAHGFGGGEYYDPQKKTWVFPGEQAAPPASTYTAPGYEPGGPTPAGTARFDGSGNLIPPASGWQSTLNFDMNNKSAQGNNNDIATAMGGGTGTKTNPAQAIQDYIQGLTEETTALNMGKEALAEYRAEKAAATAAGEQLKDLTPSQVAAIKAVADANEQATLQQQKLRQEQEKQIQVTAQLEAQISSSLADIAINYKNMGQTITQVLDQIAKKILEDTVTTPLVNSIGQMLGAPDTSSKTGQGIGTNFLGSLFSFLPHFASGGSISGPSIVGENGPELFVPPGAGTIIPNNKLGGQNVMVYQTINMSPGLPETVNAAIRNAAPGIAAMAHAGVMQAIQKGGPDAKIIGLRS